MEVTTMARLAFRLRLRTDCVEAYEEAHRHVWPELLQLLKDVGVSEYSIFRRDVDLFLYMHVDDFDRAWNLLDQSPVNRSWQLGMQRLFEPPGDLRTGERFPMMHEVFYLR
jgi:L-rhamnose mutarotase